MKIFLSLILIAVGLCPQLSYSELSESEKKAVLSGEVIIKENASSEFKNAPWPVMTYYLKVKSSPIVGISIFGALEYQQSYVPDTLLSKPIKEISPVEIHTEYEMKVPFPFSNARHVHGSILSRKDLSYSMKWYYVHSNATKNTSGHALFSPLNETESLLEYQTFVWPNSSLASLVESVMKKKTLIAVKAIREHIELLNEKNSPLIPQFVKRTQDALNGKYVYTDIIKK
jgi:hypothetical protein